MLGYNEIMNDLVEIGAMIKETRLSRNLRMDDIARQTGITRATLWSIEKGSKGISAASLLKVLNVLGLSFSINSDQQSTKRKRATRINSVLDKKINRFIIMTVEYYAASINKPSDTIYKKLKDKGIIDELRNDYEDLHGMSTYSINEYISRRLSE